MKKSAYIEILLVFLCFILPNTDTRAYDNKVTHRSINEIAVRNKSEIDLVLKQNLGFPEGILDKIGNDEIGEWIVSGGEKEDEPFWRCLRHFHDPTKSWDDAGLPTFLSSIYWAQIPEPQDEFDPRNDFSWPLARMYYYQALTTGSEQEWVKTFRSLGQIMHLLSDKAVPAHVRNDPHIVRDPYEYWVRNNNDVIKTINFSEVTVDREIFNSFVSNVCAPSPVSALWDHDEYMETQSTVPADSNTGTGLSEYTNANFWTEDTFSGEYAYPRIADTNHNEDVWLNPVQHDAEDGQVDQRIYFHKQLDDSKEPFVAIDYYYFWLNGISTPLPSTPDAFILDEKCHEAYAKKLIPRAIAYSSALLDYFFRGRLQVTALPIFFENGIFVIRLNIKNMTPSLETMETGEFSLVVRYTPEGGAEDGSDDIFIQSTTKETIEELPYESELEALFYLPDSVPISRIDKVQCMLAFKGTLGNEANAVVGKSFSLGEVLLNEEWDNGLHGNHQWQHTEQGDIQNPDNGTTSNVINSGVLVKDNIRYAGSPKARFNSSQFSFVDDNNSNGMLITPDAYIQFKSNDFSINVQPPASPGTTSAWQQIWLRFNNGLHLMYSVEGQGVNWGTGLEAHYTFTPGYIILDNIHALFQPFGIEVPDPLYLKDINFHQQFWTQTSPSTEEHHQHMEIDFIRIVKEKNDSQE